MPEPVRALLAVLAAKPKGGYRCLGMYPSWYRVWAKAQRRPVVDWEEEHNMPFFQFCGGGSCIHA
eukprot:7056871-Lingulodinium_polyedra.AAC.1